jgi:ribosome-associated toxin RatA of RatAB toxin-antitoxin module
MRSVNISAAIPGNTAGESFAILRRMEQFPRFADVVLDLQVVSQGPDRTHSTWKVKFGPGTATWSQEDAFDDSAKTVRFHRLAGDIDDFSGSWTLSDAPSGCLLEFNAKFDTGLFLLAPIVEPMVEALLREHIRSILRGLFDEKVIFHG